MQTTPHLHFNGTCEEAFEFYEQLFGGKIETLIPWSDIPENGLPADMQGKITHASLTLEDGGTLAGSDTPPARYQTPAGFGVILSFKGEARAQRIFDGLAQGGRVDMPLQQTFWAARFGMVTDRFGIPWMVNATAEG
jgi:PhnB protein